MKVLVTGTKGWAGRAVVETLARQHQVRAFDRPEVEWNQEAIRDNYEEVTGDIADYDTVRRAMQGVQAVVHMAVASHRSHSLYGTEEAPAPSVPFAVNVQGTYNVLESAWREGVRRVVIVGSASLEQLQADPPFKLDHQVEWLEQPGMYGLTKYLQERIGWFYATTRGLEVIVLRCGFIVDGASNQTKYGASLDDTDPWDKGSGGWIDRFDLAEACRRALEIEHTGFDMVYLIGWHGGEAYYDVDYTQRKLGMEFRYRFEHVK